MKKTFPRFGEMMTKSIPALLTSCLLIVGCTTENEQLDSIEELSTTNESYATPAIGKIYTITNRKSGRTVDINGASNLTG